MSITLHYLEEPKILQGDPISVNLEVKNSFSPLDFEKESLRGDPDVDPRLISWAQGISIRQPQLLPTIYKESASV